MKAFSSIYLYLSKKKPLRFARLTFAVLLVALVSLSFRNTATTWVAIGDSITYLNDHLDETGNRVTKGYLSRVVEKFEGLTYINKGYNGWTSGGIADKINELGLVKADIYSVFLGTNDWWQGRPVGNFNDYKQNSGNSTLYGSFRIIIDKIRSLNPDAKILLITPLQRADFIYVFDYNNNAFGSYRAKNGQYLEQFANAIDSIGRHEHIPVLDLYHDPGLAFNHIVKFKRLKDPETGEYKNYKYPKAADIPFEPKSDDYPYPIQAINMTYDGLHPSDKGNAVIANRIARIFLELGVTPKR